MGGTARPPTPGDSNTTTATARHTSSCTRYNQQLHMTCTSS
jgi:hypothetical protein